MRVEVMLYVYLFVCGAMIVFNVINAVLFRKSERRTEKVSKNLRDEVMLQLKAAESDSPVDDSHKRFLSRKLRRVGNMIAFDKMLEAEYTEHPEKIHTYLHSLDGVFVSLMAYYARRDRIEAAYFPYIIKKYRVIAYRSFPSMEGVLLALLNEPSIYCRENAMQALYTTGDADCILTALKIIDRSGLFFHRKLLSDGLLNFSGSSRLLGERITESFFYFSVEMQVTLLDYLRFSGDEYRAFSLSLLNNAELNDEIRYAAIRYLGKYPLSEAYEPLRRLAEDNSEQRWEYAAIASTALTAYPGNETVETLKRNLYSRNWYVRLNSAVSLKSLGITYSELSDIIDGNDRYASEIITYCLQRDYAEGQEVAHV